ncbi:MAG TPA: hypothetical protein VJ598_03515 [Albitalea sp.]|nr:hypothetical protein [Albitalea sp.]
MFGLTPLGLFHTAIGLIAVGAGLAALVRDKRISPANTLGKVYLIATLVTALSALGIFQHGGFGPAHGLAIVTLVALAIAAVAANTRLFGAASRYVETVAYSATFLFHMIPGVTESSTRLVGAPMFASPEAPALKAANGVLLLAFLIGATLQVRWLRRTPA